MSSCINNKLKWRNDRRSERNLCNCVMKPEKNSELHRGLNPWPRDTSAMLYQLSYFATDVGSRSIVGSLVPVKEMSVSEEMIVAVNAIYAFAFFFSGFFTKLHKLRSLRQSFLHFHFISAVRIWFISHIINNNKLVGLVLINKYLSHL